MIKIIRNKYLLVACFFFAICVSCGRSQEQNNGSTKPPLSRPIEAALPQPDFFDGERFIGGSILVVRVDPKLADGRSAAVVLLRGYGMQKSLLLMMCARHSFVEDQNNLFVLGKLQADEMCPGMALSDGFFLKRDDDCFTEPNRSQVYVIERSSALIESCDVYSVEKSKRTMYGKCDSPVHGVQFDTLGLVRCSERLNKGL